MIAEHKFQGSGNLTEKYYINHKKSRDQPNAHSRSMTMMDGEDSVDKNLISATQQESGVHKQGYEK